MSLRPYVAHGLANRSSQVLEVSKIADEQSLAIGSNGRANVRFWHLADIDPASENVRYWG